MEVGRHAGCDPKVGHAAVNGTKSIAALVREALHAGAQTPREVHLLRPSVSISRARRACLDMAERGAIRVLPDGTYRGTRHIASEAAYRAHELALRRAAALARRPPALKSTSLYECPTRQRDSGIITGRWA